MSCDRSSAPPHDRHGVAGEREHAHELKAPEPHRQNERDLEQRGAGQFLGTRQSGFGEFKMANITDVRLIEKARRSAQILFEQDNDLSQSANVLLKAVFERAWGDTKGDIS